MSCYFLKLFVAEGHALGGSSSREGRDRAKVGLIGPQKYTHRAAAPVGRHYVHNAIAIEIRHGRRHWMTTLAARCQCPMQRERAAAVSQQNADVVRLAVGHGQVEMPIVVEIPRRHRIGTPTARHIRDGRCECSVFTPQAGSGLGLVASAMRTAVDDRAQGKRASEAPPWLSGSR